MTTGAAPGEIVRSFCDHRNQMRGSMLSCLTIRFSGNAGRDLGAPTIGGRQRSLLPFVTVTRRTESSIAHPGTQARRLSPGRSRRPDRTRGARWAEPGARPADHDGPCGTGSGPDSPAAGPFDGNLGLEEALRYVKAHHPIWGIHNLGDAQIGSKAEQ
jgi:hypothetical protein